VRIFTTNTIKILTGSIYIQYASLVLSIPIVYFYPLFYPVILLAAFFMFSKFKNIFFDEAKIIGQALDQSPLFIFTQNLSSAEIIYSNKGLLNFLGYSSSEFKQIRKTAFLDLIHPEDKEVIEKSKKMLGLLRDDEVLDINFRLKKKNNEYCSIRNRYAPFKTKCLWGNNRSSGFCRRHHQ
jgi:PAS domain-containing protein